VHSVRCDALADPQLDVAGGLVHGRHHLGRHHLGGNVIDVLCLVWECIPRESRSTVADVSSGRANASARLAIDARRRSRAGARPCESPSTVVDDLGLDASMGLEMGLGMEAA
jgi:hypothetical protein